jgi:ABC-type microcin C transport system duplicated ATPase subunit YejF
MEEKKQSEKKKTQGKSYPNRILAALESIFTDPSASIDERLQALRLSAEILPYRPQVKRKSEKDKVVLAALNKSNPNANKNPREYNFSKKKGPPEGDPENSG